MPGVSCQVREIALPGVHGRQGKAATGSAACVGCGPHDGTGREAEMSEPAPPVWTPWQLLEMIQRKLREEREAKKKP